MVGVGVVRARCGEVVQLLAVTRRRLEAVDDVEDLGAAEAGDPHATHEERLGLKHVGEAVPQASSSVVSAL